MEIREHDGSYYEVKHTYCVQLIEKGRERVRFIYFNKSAIPRVLKFLKLHNINLLCLWEDRPGQRVTHEIKSPKVVEILNNLLMHGIIT